MHVIRPQCTINWKVQQIAANGGGEFLVYVDRDAFPTMVFENFRNRFAATTDVPHDWHV